MRHRIAFVVIAVTGLVAAGCAGGARMPAGPRAADAKRPMVVVHKTPACSCCGDYETYLKREGFQVRTVVRDDIAPLRTSMGVPDDLQSCHTSVVAGYFIEGHMPVEAIDDLLRDRPDIDGIALPGMPPGSPGMGGVRQGRWTVYAVTGGSVEAFGTY